MKSLFHNFPKNIRTIFSGRNLLWHFLAIILTYIIVITDFDWFYYEATRFPHLRQFIFPAVALGGLLPILVPLSLLILGLIRKNFQLKNIALAIGQAAILGSLISSFYKAFTGRAHPEGFLADSINNNSHIFNFGFWRGGIFWGWPSSHTTIAFAMALALTYLFPQKKFVRILALAYAFYVGVSVSVSIHWFSDFVAGAIIGSVIGITVGKSFSRRTPEKEYDNHPTERN